MEIKQIADRIEEKIKLLAKIRGVIKSRAEDKAKSSAGYDKKIAITIMSLQAGKEVELEGEKIQSPPATITEKIAKGVCWEEKLEMDKAEALYKCAISNINSVSSELNGLQSIFRWLDE